MKLTVITINYNNLSGLKKTVPSVLEQTYQDFEYIIIDGGSTDGGSNFIESYSDKLNYWISERDGGVYNAMNKGILKATGEYIILMNSGDTFYSADTLEKVLPELESGEDIIYGNAFFFNRINNEPDSLWLYPKKLGFDFFCEGALNHQAVFTRKSLHDARGGYSENYKLISDWLFMLEAFVYGGASYKYLDMTICNYDQSGFSAQNWDKAVLERSQALKTRFTFFSQRYHEGDSGPVLKRRTPRNLKQLLKKFFKMLLPYGIVRYLQLKLKQKTK
jgi:glycosyltransferase involved in cell wall biosynthesis